jgi:hypothetical protein
VHRPATCRRRRRTPLNTALAAACIFHVLCHSGSREESVVSAAHAAPSISAYMYTCTYTRAPTSQPYYIPEHHTMLDRRAAGQRARCAAQALAARGVHAAARCVSSSARRKSHTALLQQASARVTACSGAALCSEDVDEQPHKLVKVQGAVAVTVHSAHQLNHLPLGDRRRLLTRHAAAASTTTAAAVAAAAIAVAVT